MHIAKVEPVPLDHSALVVWDMQRAMKRRSIVDLEGTSKKVRQLIDAAHETGIKVIYSQTTGILPEHQTKFGSYDLRRRGLDPKTTILNEEGSDDWKFLEGLEPESRDLVIKKYNRNFFVGTLTDQILRALNIDTLILCGVATHIGVESTARYAADIGYIPVLAKDAMSGPDEELNEMAIKVMASLYDVRTTENIIGALMQLKKRSDL